MGQNEEKPSKYRTVTNDDLRNYFLAGLVNGGKIEDIPLRYQFLFCASWYGTDDGENHRCGNVVDFVRIEWATPTTPLLYYFVCKNCKLQKVLKATAARLQQKWLGGPDRKFTVTHWEIEKSPNEENINILMVNIPPGKVIRLEEEVNGPNRYFVEQTVYGDRKALYYLKDILPAKVVKELQKRYDPDYGKKKCFAL